MKDQLQKLRDNWMILSAIAVIVLIPYIKDLIGDVVTEDISTTPTIIQMNTAIASNTAAAKTLEKTADRFEKKVDDLEDKIDRLVEIMLIED